MQNPKYDVLDEVVIKASNVAIYNAIIDVYDGKNNWWLPSLTSKIKTGNTIAKISSECIVTIHALIPIKFITKTIETKPNEMIRVSYTKGAFKGEGIWELKQTGDTTKLTFRWLTSPNSILIKIIAPFFPITKDHSAVMQKGFKNLKEMLEK
jgi:ribosome-associated toxin RatA of RatAB toxin-antitoxin module